MKILILFLISSCSQLFYQPNKVIYSEPQFFLDSVEEAWFNSKDGTKLHSLWIPSSNVKPKGTIVFFHGNAQNLTSHIFHLAWITKEGYNLFIFDYRGYGKSEGIPSQEGIFEDSLAALNIGLDFHKKISPNKNFIIYGQSLGGVISLRSIASWEDRDKISLIVQDSTFMSYQKIAFDKLKSHFLTFLFSPLTYLLISDKYSSDKVVKEIKNPLLIISGTKDQVVPYKFSEEIFNKSKSEKKWFWKIKDGVHADVFALHNHKYRAEFLDLINSL